MPPIYTATFDVEDISVPPPPDPPPTTGTNPLSIPANAVAATTANYTTVIGNNSGGAVRLANGTYNMNQLTVNCHLFGEDPTGAGVILEGGMTREYAMRPGSGRTIARMTMQGYLGRGSEKGYSPIYGDGITDLRLDTLITRRNLHAGLRIGTGWLITNWQSYENGQYGAAGTGLNSRVQHFLWYRNGNEGISGVTRYALSDRGGSKFVGSSNLILEDGETYGHQDTGLWFDGGDNVRPIIRRVYSHDNIRHGLNFEITGASPKLVEDCRFENNASKVQQQNYRDANIFLHTSAGLTVRRTRIGGGRNGMIGWQLASRIDTQSNPGYAVPVQNVLIENSTFLSCTNIVTGIVGSTWNGISPYSTASNNRWVNNVYPTGNYAWNGSTSMTRDQWLALSNVS